MNKIIKQIRNHWEFNYAELKCCTMDENAEPNRKIWDKGTTLKSNDTIMSCQLYQDDCVIIAKLIKDKASYSLFPCDLT
jgi:hypothetical protein